MYCIVHACCLDDDGDDDDDDDDDASIHQILCSLPSRNLTRILFQTSGKRENKVYLKLLQSGVQPEGVGRSMYFSHYYDITLTAQKTAVR